MAVQNRKKGYFLISAFLLIVLGVMGILAFVNPMEAHWMPHCPVYTVTGTYCPGCGSTRALYALAHGQFFQAFDHNPLMIILLPFVTYGLLSRARVLMFGKTLPGPNLPPWSLWTLFGIIVAYWIARNLPWEPFTFLAP